MQRFLVTFGLALVVVGLAWPWLARLGLGRLPGDIHFEHAGYSFHLPLTTCLLVSALVSLLLWLLRR